MAFKALADVAKRVSSAIEDTLPSISNKPSPPSAADIAAFEKLKNDNLGKPTYPLDYQRLTADDVRKYGIGMPNEDEEKNKLAGLKKGGRVKSIDGIALRGKTRAKLKGR